MKVWPYNKDLRLGIQNATLASQSVSIKNLILSYIGIGWIKTSLISTYQLFIKLDPGIQQCSNYVYTIIFKAVFL